MTFTQVRLANQRVLVKGTDQAGTDGQQVLDGSQWDEIQERLHGNQAEQVFSAEVQEFFKPLTDAVDKLEASKAAAETDEDQYFVISEPVTGTAPKPGHRVKLYHDTRVLQLLSQGKHDRLLWVNDSLEITEAPQVTASPSTNLISGSVSDSEG